MAHVAQMLMQEPIYKFSSIFCFKPILLSAHKLILLIYGDNTTFPYTADFFGAMGTEKNKFPLASRSGASGG